ncbi:MAG: hypothetical protein AMS22_06295 [Thiotrichales bacterium SG8_50]|nr:MAG: hypothetical protein AMS22_06295 [Thiotrichales bacterium SG8_50]
MKTEEQIKTTLFALAAQRDRATPGSAAQTMLNQRIFALAWVTGHPKAVELVMTDDAFSLLDCIG